MQNVFIGSAMVARKAAEVAVIVAAELVADAAYRASVAAADAAQVSAELAADDAYRASYAGQAERTADSLTAVMPARIRANREATIRARVVYERSRGLLSA